MLRIGRVKDENYYIKTNHLSEYYGRENSKGKILRVGLFEDVKITIELDEKHVKLLASVFKGKSRLGFDFVFSAGKHVSLLFALTGDERIIDAFFQSVEEVMKEVANNTYTRLKRNGKVSYVKAKPLIAGFVHLLNQENEPFLHIHALLLNKVERYVDKKLTAVEPKKHFSMQVKLGKKFRKIFCQKLRTLGYDVILEKRVKRHEYEEIVVADENLRKIFNSLANLYSKRTEEIDKFAEKLKGNLAMRYAVYYTRKRKTTKLVRVKEIYDGAKKEIIKEFKKYGFTIKDIFTQPERERIEKLLENRIPIKSLLKEYVEKKEMENISEDTKKAKVTNQKSIFETILQKKLKKYIKS